MISRPKANAGVRVPYPVVSPLDAKDSSEKKKPAKTLYQRFRREADEHPGRYVAGVILVPLYALLDEISTPKEKREHGESRLQKIVGAGAIEAIKVAAYAGIYIGGRYLLNKLYGSEE